MLIALKNEAVYDFGGLFSISADGAGEAVPVSDELVKARQVDTIYWRSIPTAATNDRLVFRFYGSFLTADSNVASVSIDDGTVTVLLDSSFEEREATVSPDGRWLAYTSDESGQFEVYARSFSPKGPRWPISTNGGREPVWSPDGAELFYLESQGVMAVPISSTEEGLDPGKPSQLFEWRFAADAPSYDIAPDGERFIMIRPTEDSGVTARTEIRVIVNWLEELKRLVPTDN